MKPTLFKYILKMQMKAIFLVSLFFFGLIVVFNFAEASRHAPIDSFDGFTLITKAVVLGALSTFAEIMHYIYFITATFNLWHLCKSQQMIILKSSGQSPLQILYPFISCAATAASLWLFAMHPAGIFGDRESHNIMPHAAEQQCNENVWIDYPDNNRLIFIKKLTKQHASDLYIFDKNSAVIADSAVVNKQNLTLQNGVKITKDRASSFENLLYDNQIDQRLMRIISSPPQKQSIYNLREVYEVEKANGVSLKKYEIALQKLLVNWFTFILFALIAAVICFPISRYNSKTSIVVKVIVIAIVMRFLSSIFEAMAYTGVLSPFTAAWIVVLFAACISIAVLIWREV